MPGGPDSIRIPYDDPGARIKATEENARAAEKQVKELEKALIQAAQTDGKVSRAQVDKLNDARKRSDDLREQVNKSRKEEIEQKSQTHKFNQTARKYAQFDRRINMVLNNELFRKMASGQNLNILDVIHASVATDRAMLALGRATGIKALTKIGIAMPLVSDITQNVFALLAQDQAVRKANDMAPILAAQLDKRGLGRMTDKTFAYITKGEFDKEKWTLQGYYNAVTGNTPADRKAQLDARVNALSVLTPTEANEALQKASEDINWDVTHSAIRRSAKGKVIEGQLWQRLVDMAIQDAQRKSATSLTKEQIAAIEEGIATTFHLSSIAMEKLNAAVAVHNENRIHNWDVSQRYWRRHEELLFQSAWQTHNKRIPNNPTD